MYDRFDHDFQKVAQELNLGEGFMTDDEIMINLSQMSKLYLQLGFTKPDSGESDQAQLAAIWKNIGGDKEG